MLLFLGESPLLSDRGQFKKKIKLLPIEEMSRSAQKYYVYENIYLSWRWGGKFMKKNCQELNETSRSAEKVMFSNPPLIGLGGGINLQKDYF